MAIECDVAIIGGGPGGYVAAIRAAQLGAQTLLIEKDQLGGTCVNRGCIPSKALLEAAERMLGLGQSEQWGITVDGYSADYRQVQTRKDRVVSQLRAGVETLVKGNGISLLRGSGSILSPGQIAVRMSDGSTEQVTSRHTLIATGSVEARLPIPGIDNPGIMGSTDALNLTEIPDSIAIVGGGYIGVEFATVFRAFGSKVTVIEMMPTLLPASDKEIGNMLGRLFQRQGIEVKVGAKVTAIEQADGQYRVSLAAGDREEIVEASRVLVALGRWPYTEGLGLERIGVELDGRAIKTDSRLTTTVPEVYAIGDVNGQWMLAHTAYLEGELAVENALDYSDDEMDYRAIPSAVFSSPQVASVGLTEDQASEAGYDVRVGRFPFGANAKAVASGHTDGTVKVVSESRYGQILGIHMIGHLVSELLAEATMAVNLETTIDEFARTIHPHPTLSESIREAVLDSAGRVVHRVRARRR